MAQGEAWRAQTLLLDRSGGTGSGVQGSAWGSSSRSGGGGGAAASGATGAPVPAHASQGLPSGESGEQAVIRPALAAARSAAGLMTEALRMLETMVIPPPSHAFEGEARVWVGSSRLSTRASALAG